MLWEGSDVHGVTLDANCDACDEDYAPFFREAATVPEAVAAYADTPGFCSPCLALHYAIWG